MLTGTPAEVATARSIATAQTMARDFATAGGFAMASGTCYFNKLPVQAANFSAFTTCVTGTAKTGGSHGWYAILDSFGNVLCATQDLTDAAATWGTPNAEQLVSLSPAYQSYYAVTQLLYAAVCIVASQMPTLASGVALAGGVNGQSPVLCGTAGTGLTTPPAVGSKLALTASAAFPFYGFTS